MASTFETPVATTGADAAIDDPNPGQAGALSEICRPHSPHSINAIGNPFAFEVP